MARPVATSRRLFERLKWPVPAKAPYDIMITFGDGAPPFLSGVGRWTATLHMRSKKDSPEWSIGVSPPKGRGTEIWEGKFMSNSLDLPLLADLAAFPDWMRAVRARAGHALSVAFVDAGRNEKAEPHVERWLGWHETAFASTQRAASNETSLLDWAGAPTKPYGPKDLPAEQRRVARQLETDARLLTGPQLRRVTDRIVAQSVLFLRSTLNASLPESVRRALAASLSDKRAFQACVLQHLFLSIALRTAPRDEVAAHYKAVGTFFSKRLAGLLEARSKIPVTSPLVKAAREACLRFELPKLLPLCTNADASVFLLLAMDGSHASADALRRVVGVLHAATTAGRPDTDLHERVARIVARDVGSAAFQRRLGSASTSLK